MHTCNRTMRGRCACRDPADSAMKNLLITLAVAAALCVGSFVWVYRLNDKPMLRQAAKEGDTMLWLRAEFDLDDAQFAAIDKLHDDFAEKCVGHCRAIADAKRRSADP